MTDNISFDDFVNQQIAKEEPPIDQFQHVRLGFVVDNSTAFFIMNIVYLQKHRFAR